MSSSVDFVGPGGLDPASHILLIRGALEPTAGDGLFGGFLLIGEIRDRTLKGVDVHGSPFAPYSKKYAARKAKEVGHERVDLFSGLHHTHMLNALQVVAGGSPQDPSSVPESPEPIDLFSVGIFSNSELETRARLHNEGGGRQPVRNWLDASPEDIEMIEREMGKRIDRRIQLTA